MMQARPRDSYTLQYRDGVIICLLAELGFNQSNISALFECNVGRVNEVIKGNRFSQVAAMSRNQLLQELVEQLGWNL